MLDIIDCIYTDRKFKVAECGGESELRRQEFGISQGCPLSPFLFGIVMTVLMTDAVAMLSPEAKIAYLAGDLSDVVYADDTLLMSSHGPFLQEFATAVERTGLEYGLTLHWGKAKRISIGNDDQILAPDGSLLERSPSLTYLGSVVHDSGYPATELSRRLGMCGALFKKLSRAWSHSGIARTRKILLYKSIVVSKLMYGLTTMWLGAAEQRKLDGFHASCLRRILRIPAAYTSRISNERVYAEAGEMKLSRQLVERQLGSLRKILAAPADCAVRAATFLPNSSTPITAAFVRKVGRPRHTWAEQLMQIF
jgi:hypothetical protein